MVSISSLAMNSPLSSITGTEPMAEMTNTFMAGKFDALMQNLRNMPAHNPAADSASIVTNLVQTGNTSVQSVMDQVQRFNDGASMMSSQEFSAAGIALTMDTAMVMFQLNAGMGMVHSSKSAVQILFKNQ